VHLEIDTGMSRQGASVDELAVLLTRFSAESPLRIEAVMTHLYASDEANGETTPEQLLVLRRALDSICRLPEGERRPEFLSVGASAALIGGTADQLKAVAAEWKLRPMLRLGLAIYGLVPTFDPAFAPNEIPAELAAARSRLKPVLEWKSRVVSVRKAEAGTEVGYNGTFIASEPMRLALIAAGYADGVDRRLGNHFSFLVRGQRAPVVGRVSMDQIVVDVTEIPDCAAGDEAVLLGVQGGETITAVDHADTAGTIPWEIFTRIAPRVQRIAV
jgi:alanine racemase